MGVAVYPRIENTEADWVHQISGKALSKCMGKLSKLIKKRGFKDLMDYYVESQEQLDDLHVQQSAEVKWFNPIEGLALVEAMTEAFKEHRGEFDRPENLEKDLECFHAILDRAASEGLRWNLGMSY